jgi:hypothetical protein
MTCAHSLPLTLDALTPELQHAMAAYEAARIRYRAVVRASLDGRVDGASIRAAIDDVRVAHFELERCRARKAVVAEGAHAPAGWRRLRARLAEVARRALRIVTRHDDGHGELRAAS